MAKTIYATAEMPVKQVLVSNSKGYLDLLVNRNKNGKAIRIADRTNGHRVHVTMDSINALIDALLQVRDNGVQLSVDEVEYDAAT